MPIRVIYGVFGDKIKMVVFMPYGNKKNTFKNMVVS